MQEYEFAKEAIRNNLAEVVSQWFNEQNTEESAKEIKKKLSQNRDKILGSLIGFDTKWNDWELDGNKLELIEEVKEQAEKYLNSRVKNLLKEGGLENSFKIKIDKAIKYEFSNQIYKRVKEVIEKEVEGITADKILDEINQVYLKLSEENNG